jgi:hypothetical protein
LVLEYRFVEVAARILVNFLELENRVVSATYRNLVIRAKVVLLDEASGEQPVRSHHHDLIAGAERNSADQTVGFDQACALSGALSMRMATSWRKAPSPRSSNLL